MSEQPPKEASQVKVAKISALQAVIVATITAVAGLLAGYMSRPPVHEPPAQRWVVIDGAETNEHSLIRVVVMVNGLHFSYPSTSVWAEVGPSMSQERFPLPNAADYKVSFRAFLSNPGPVATVAGEANYVDNILEVPSGERIYKLYPVEGSYRGASPVLRVRYHIE